MGFNLRFIAGSKAFVRIRDKGLDSNDVAVLAGASGAAKWQNTGQKRFYKRLLESYGKNV